MTERKFTRGLGKPGMAAQLRETVKTKLKVQNKPHLVSPIDFENFILKNKTLIQNDPHRELLLYPQDDILKVVLPRLHRTIIPSSQGAIQVADATEESLLTKESLQSYTSDWNLVHYKYSGYSGTYLELPKLPPIEDLKEQVYEIDTDVDQIEEDGTKNDGITKQGYLMKGPEIGSTDRMFANIGSKSFKRRYCHLRQEVDGTYILELFKDDKKGETKLAIVMDFCTDVIRNPKRGRYCMELRMSGTHKSYVFAADNEIELQDWLFKLSSVLLYYKQQEEKRAASLERAGAHTPPPSPVPTQIYGTLKGLEQSMNPQLIKYSRETDMSIALARKENRKRLFLLYPNMFHAKQHSPEKFTENNGNCVGSVEPYKEQFGQRIFVKCESLKFRLQAPIGEKECLSQVEPYYTTLALFDARNARKLSENFHFDINNQIMKDLMDEVNGGGEGEENGEAKKDGLEKVPVEWVKQCKQAIFSISNPHPDIFLVVRIEKILQGSICQSSEPYSRAAKDPRLGLKVHKQVKACMQRLGNYRMPFAWSARPLFRLYSNELDTSSDFPAIYRQENNKIKDEELLKLLSEYRKPDKLNKLTVIPGWLKIKIEAIADIPENCLTTSLVPLKPFPLPPTCEATIEIAEFESCSEKEVHPYTTYVNHLYVYPQNLSFDSQKIFTRARNIACVVELKDDDSENASSLFRFYSRPDSSIMCNKISCAVLHHNSVPSWYEEIKIHLPTRLHSKHHLLFSFYHISCDMNKKKENRAETCVGHAWIPLLLKGRILVGTESTVQILPVATHLPPGYLSIQPLGLGKGNAGPEITWIDSQKPIFSVDFQLLSTVFTRDLHLHNLFAHAERMTETKISAMPSDSETCKILKAAHAIQLATAITFLPTLLNQLFKLLVHQVSDEVALCVIRLLIHVINSIQEAGRKDILDSYVKYVFLSPARGNGNVTVHEQLAQHLTTLLQPTNTDFLVVNKFMHHSNFFFEIVIKSMAQHLLESGRIKMHRNERFSEEYHAKIKSLLVNLVPHLVNKYKELPLETQELNKSLANFLKRCLTFMDRGFVFQLVNLYMDIFAPSDSRALHDFKFTFLQIICSHEHYVSFNLPMMQSRVTSKENEIEEEIFEDGSLLNDFCLTEEFHKHHFLVGLLLQEIKTSLNELLQIRKLAIVTLRDLLAKHELDDRYQNKGQLSRIASIYIPWISIVLDNLHRLDCISEKMNPISDAQQNSHRVSVGSTYFSTKEFFSSSVTASPKSANRLTFHLDMHSPIRASMHLQDNSYFAAIAGQGMVNGFSCTSIESEGSTLSSVSQSNISQETTINRETAENGINKLGSTENNHQHQQSCPIGVAQSARCDKLQVSEAKDSLICFLFIIKYLENRHIINWWQQSSESDILSFFTAIEMCLENFKYIGKRQIAMNVRKEPGKTRTVKAMTLPARIIPPDFSSENGAAAAVGTLQSHNTVTRENLVENNDVEKMQSVLLDANLATEVGLIALDCLGLFGIHFKEILLGSNGDNPVMEKVFNIYLLFLQIGQSETLLRHVFAGFRSFLNNYSVVFFKGNAVLCGRLCYELLRCCNSKLSLVRQESCALLYLLMRSNFEFTNRKGLTRVHLQVIISVSQMLGNVIGLNNSRFQESLSLINSYASSDKVMKGTGFSIEVKDLNKRIRTVLMATAQMKEHNNDPEMLVDLQHSLANSYASTPELRHTWLEAMARNHLRLGNFSEAACCQLHIAALMAEYLKLKKVHDWGAEAFDKISTNISKDERGLKLDAGVQDVHYNENVLLDQLETCADMIEKAERFELLGHVYRLIVPIYERRNDYEALSNCYSHLTRACNKVVEVTRSGKRLLGRFYRVAFFGSAYFDEEHGQEYIYKEPKVTSLSEMSERLYRLHLEKFGAENVKMVMDSTPVDALNLDQKMAYIQVTHVTPYWEKEELEEPQTEFLQNHDVSCFMFETPFTKDGKVRGSPENQWKRRTIIKTQYSFPYVKKRISVTEKRTMELSPIEVALDEMKQRVQELEQVALVSPTDVKKLQLRLQGSVCVTVNAGPLAYASAFLDPALSPQYPDDQVDELKGVFKEFVKICYTALQINSKLIAANQQEYQQVLHENYEKFCQNLSSLLGESAWRDDHAENLKRNSALFGAISATENN